MIKIDPADVADLRAAIERLPQEIKVKAMSRALKSVTNVARNRLVRRQSPRIKLSADEIRARTTAMFNAGGNTQSLIVRSNWIPLYKLGAVPTAEGVAVRLRGSYRHAFIATMKSGHTGVMMRVGKERFPIRELFGPNPAHDITNNDEIYIEMLAEVIEEFLVPSALREIEKVLPR